MPWVCKHCNVDIILKKETFIDISSEGKEHERRWDDNKKHTKSNTLSWLKALCYCSELTLNSDEKGSYFSKLKKIAYYKAD